MSVWLREDRRTKVRKGLRGSAILQRLAANRTKASDVLNANFSCAFEILKIQNQSFNFLYTNL